MSPANSGSGGVLTPGALLPRPSFPTPAVTDTGFAKELLDHLGWIERLARSISSNADEAEDLAQETWYRALSSPPRSKQNLRSWLAVVLRNAAREQKRSEAGHNAHHRVIAAESGQGFAQPAEDSLERGEDYSSLLSRVLALSDTYRSTILLRYVQQASIEDIATVLGLSTHAVRSHITRALRTLRMEPSGRVRARPTTFASSRLEDILHDLSRDPRAHLLRINLSSTSRESFDPSPVANAAAAGLRPCERALLESHREEAAMLLKEVCKHRLMTEMPGCLYLTPPPHPDIHGSPSYAPQGAGRALPASMIRVIESLVSTTSGKRPSVAQVALASLRLVPSNYTRLCLGLALAFEKKHDVAFAQSRIVLGSSSGPIEEFIAWTNLAMLNTQITKQIECNRRALMSKIDPVYGCSAWVNLLGLALVAYDLKLARLAADRLAELSRPDELLARTNQMVERQRLALWHPPRSLRPIARAFFRTYRTSDPALRGFVSALLLPLRSPA